MTGTIPEYDPDSEYLGPATTPDTPRELTDDEADLMEMIRARGGDLHRKMLDCKTLRHLRPALRSLLADGFLFRSRYAGHVIMFDRHNLPKDTE